MIPRVRSKLHLDYLRGLPCTICGDPTSTEASHIRYAEPRAAKPITGLGVKASDVFVLPLCHSHHELQHHVGDERKFWRSVSIDPIFVAMALFVNSGDYGAGLTIINTARAAHQTAE